MKRVSIALVLAALAACDSGGGVTVAATSASAPKPAASPSVPRAAKSAPAPIVAPPDLAAPPADAQKSASGLASKVLKAGSGSEHPGAEDKVKVHYTGWTKSGKMFGDTTARGTPTSMSVNGAIKGWGEGLQLMVVGEKRRLWIPAALAYGDEPRMVGAPAGDLVLDVELVSIEAAPKPIAAPADVAAPPKDAKKTASGLVYKLLAPGKGTRAPKATDRVRVHYTGWTKDGNMFDSSVQKGQPASFALNGVIKGWTEGLQLMKEGDKMRFWIPADLAYGDTPSRPGGPSGQLTFDVELIAVQ